jgi:hypothetical protein
MRLYRDKTQQRALATMGVWLTLIFVTSCFVVPFQTFVQFIQGLLPANAFKHWFAGFWLACWFFVVKGWHATEYAILLTLCKTALQAWKPWSRTRCITVAFAFTVLFAASDEWHQTFVPGRDGNVQDVLIDTAGATLAALLLLSRKPTPRSQTAETA